MYPKGSWRLRNEQGAKLLPRLVRSPLLWLGLLAVVAMVALLLVGRGGQTAVVPKSAENLRVEPWPSGLVRAYEVTLEAEVRGEAPILVASFSGQLVLTEATPAGSGRDRVLVARLTPKRARLRSNPEHSSKFQERLAQRTVLRMAATGHIEGVAFPEADPNDSVDAVAQSNLRTLLAGLQVTVPSGSRGDQWLSVERDMTGSYRARYEQSEPDEFKKSKVEYISIRHGAEAGAKTEIDASRSTIHTDGALGLHRMTRLDLAEDTHTTGNGVFPEFRAKLRITARRVTPPDSDRGAADVSKLAFAPLDEIDSRQPVRSARMDELKGQTWRDLAEDVKRLQEAHEPAKRARAYANLAAVLRYREGAVRQVVAEIKANEASRYLLIHALGDAGSPAAQEALIQLFDVPALTDADRKNIVYALSMVETPHRGTTAFLQSIVDDDVHKLQARYGVGTNAYYLRETDAEAASNAVEMLESRLSRASDLSEQLTYVRALGNSAHLEVYSIVEPLLAPEQPTALRAAAIDALRRVPGGKVDGAIARALADQERRVREAAIETLGYRQPTPTLVYAARDALESESIEFLKKRLIRVISDWVDRAPALRDSLRRLSTSDESEEVRSAAATALASR